MGNKVDLFAPPTSKELARISKEPDFFAPPSENEIRMAKLAAKGSDGLDAAKIKFQEGATLGFRPAIAGVAGAAGAATGSFDVTEGLPLSERLSKAGSAAKQAFFDARKEAVEEQDRAQAAHPHLSKALNLGGSLLTVPLIPAKGLIGAIKLGSITGLGNAASTATDLKGAVTDIGTGAALGALTFGAAKRVGKGLKALGETRVGQEVKTLGSVLLDFPRKAGIKIGNVLTGVPEKEIETYATQTEKVNQMIANSGGDITAASDQVREKLSKGIQSTKQKLNTQISKALEAAPQDPIIPVSPVLEKLQAFKGKLNPNTQAEAVSQIDEMISTVSKEAKDGLVNVKSLQDIKNFLQEKGQRAFLKGGQIFSPANEAQVAAKQASSETLKILNPLAPEIAAANKQLSQLHRIESSLNKNLIAPGKPEAALLGAGSGANVRNRAMLRRLGEMTGQDALGEAERLAAVKRFGNPSWSPADTTGKSMFRFATGSALGYSAAGPVGAAIGGAMTSPAALKAAINAGQIPLGVIAKLTGGVKSLNDNTVGKLYNFLKTEAGQRALAGMLGNQAEYNPMVNRHIASEPSSNVLERRMKSR
jgi:hypothetical protein